MKIIGITGGVGSGKSRVLAYIEETYEAVICQADQVAWDLQAPGEVCYQAIVDYFGTDILNENLTINRKLLAEIVFTDLNKLHKLNAIMHPAVKAKINELIKIERKKRTRIFVLEAALLIEEHYDEICDELWYISTDEKIRRDRLKQSRNYSDEKISSIFATQLSEQEFRNKCQRVILNNGLFEETQEQIDEYMIQLGVNSR